MRRYRCRGNVIIDRDWRSWSGEDEHSGRVLPRYPNVSPVTCSLPGRHCWDVRFQHENVWQTGSHGEARAAEGRRRDEPRPPSLACRTGSPASMCSHTLIDVTLYSSGAPSRFYLVVAKCSKCFHVTDSNSVEISLRVLFLLDWKLGIVRIYLNV